MILTLARILGVLTLLFFLLASINGVKRYTKNTVVRRLARNHKLFGLLAVLSALAHLIVNLVDGTVSIIGIITVGLIFLTGLMGGSFYQTKKKSLYIAHRIVGPLAFISIMLYIIFA